MDMDKADVFRFSLSFQGNSANDHELDFYDAAEALVGFQRSLALTAHLVLNGKIITKAPYLKGARILIRPPEAGSFLITAGVICAGLYKLGTAPKDTPLGHLVYSAYDYLVRESLGFHVDYDKAIGQKYEEFRRSSKGKIDPPPLIVPTQSQMGSLGEKCENAFRQMHRPIYASETAETAQLSSGSSGQFKNIAKLNIATFAYVNETIPIERPINIKGCISSYNINTYKGRVFMHAEESSIPFDLDSGARDDVSIDVITRSLQINATDKGHSAGEVKFTALRFESADGRLKKLRIINIQHNVRA